MSEFIGIHASDLVIISAIRAALDDLRANPWLLDYVFASLKDDPYLKNEYGQSRIDQAKKWFLKTEIPVFHSVRIDTVKLPAISVTLMESSEQEHTLADVHYQPTEDDDRVWPALVDPFTPTSYIASTGQIKVPDSVANELVLAPGQVLIDGAGGQHPILSVDDRNTCFIAPNTVADFTNTVIKGARPAQIATVESTNVKETYSIGCHVQGEPVYLSYLHSILTFALLRYKESLIEGRGFERTSITASDFRRNDSFDSEMVFSRHTNITGYARQVWPKVVGPKITGTVVTPLVATPTTESPDVDLEPDLSSDDSWLAEQDGIGLKP